MANPRSIYSENSDFLPEENTSINIIADALNLSPQESIVLAFELDEVSNKSIKNRGLRREDDHSWGEWLAEKFRAAFCLEQEETPVPSMPSLGSPSGSHMSDYTLIPQYGDPSPTLEQRKAWWEERIAAREAEKQRWREHERRTPEERARSLEDMAARVRARWEKEDAERRAKEPKKGEEDDGYKSIYHWSHDS
jgi:hypothetical protein